MRSVASPASNLEDFHQHSEFSNLNEASHDISLSLSEGQCFIWGRPNPIVLRAFCQGQKSDFTFCFLSFVSSITFCTHQLPQITYLRSNLLVWWKELCLVLQANHRNILNFPYKSYWVFKIWGVFVSFSFYSQPVLRILKIQLGIQKAHGFRN